MRGTEGEKVKRERGGEKKEEKKKQLSKRRRRRERGKLSILPWKYLN